MTTERRFFSHKFEIRATDDDTKSVGGYAAVFNKDSQPLGWDGFIERIVPGAFKKTIQESDVRALFNHDPSCVLGRNKSGTLRLEEDKVGLSYDYDVDQENSDHMNVLRMVDRGDVSQSSFSFEVIRDEWEYPEDEKDPVIRTLKEVRLYDVSPVTFPAYLDTTVDVQRALRSLAGAVNRPVEELESHAKAGDLRQFIASKTRNQEPDESQEPEESREEHSDSTPMLVIARRRLEYLERRRPA